MPDKIVPDTSIVINGKLSKLLEEGKLTKCEIVIPLAVIDELQAQASRGRDVGFKGLEEIKKIRKLAEKQGISVRFSGERPGLEDIKLARSGRIDALIRDVAKSEGGILYTSDYVQALVAEAEGVPVKYVEPYERVKRFSFESYLAPNMISLHLKAGSPPYGKLLRNGRVRIVKLRNKPCSEDELNRIIEEVMATSRIGEESDVTMFKTNAVIIETKDYRISVAKPPFSDSLEAVIQRNPLKHLIKESVFKPIIEECIKGAQGILIVNQDGVYTFPIAEKIAEKLIARGKLVKILGYSRRTATSISYYGPLNGDLEKTIEYLSLSKPDYVIFDEIRRSKDFKIIHELRSLGISVIAFLNSNSLKSTLDKISESLDPILLSKTFDLIALMKCGDSIELCRIRFSFKVPSGLSEENVPRPVAEILMGGEPIFEVLEIEGKTMVLDLKEISKRIRNLRSSARKLLKDLRKIDPGARIKSAALDKVVFQVSESKVEKLTRLAPKLMKLLGVSVEFSTK